MKAPVGTLSISVAGHAANFSRNKIIEYLGEGGIMEYENCHPQKRVIDCIAEENQHEESFTYLSFDDYGNDNVGACKAEEFEDCTKENSFSFRELCQQDQSENIYNEGFDYTDTNRRYNEFDVLLWACDTLKYSPSAQAMLKEASDKGWGITLDDREGGDYCMNVEKRLLVLDNGNLSSDALARNEYFMNRLLLNLARALRDVFQERRFGGFDEHYAPQDVVLMERVRFADLDVVSVLVAWELREMGYPDCWIYIIQTGLNDIAAAFSGYLHQNFSLAIDLRQALLAAFKQWFENKNRIDVCDHDTLEYLDEVLSTNELVNPFGTKTPAKINIEMLSTLPGGAAYLQGQGAEILSNELFTAISNDINNVHLAQIIKDIKTITIDNISFNDPDLARKIFPRAKIIN